MKIELGIPKGTRDFGPEQVAKRHYIMNHIREVFELFGYEPIETPAMELLSVLTGKYGEEGDQLLFRVLNSGDFWKEVSPEDVAKGSAHLANVICEKGLRYDLTVPFARYVVMHQHELAFPFKRYQMQPVWRGDSPQKGRYREFYQCDADVVGTDSLLCEAEIVLMIMEVFRRLGIEDYTIKINHRELLRAMSEWIGAAGQEQALCVAIDKLDKIGQEGVVRELQERGFAQNQIQQLLPLFEVKGTYAEVLKHFAQQLKELASAKKAIEDLQTIQNLLEEASGQPLDTFPLMLDPTLARGLSYYTGAIFEVKVNNVAIGSVSGGGRYDNLTGTFGKEGLTGVGFSFGLDRLYDVMEALDLFPKNTRAGVDVMLVHFDTESRKGLLPLLQRLRGASIKAELYPQADKLKKQMKYAHKKGTPWVLLAGSEELQRQSVQLKNMYTGEQLEISMDEVVGFLKQKLYNG
ncbi:histidyl-tRNA synthetase [Thermonema lapsum]|uniref:Histidine--tRNA ligase n=1 Tax=Thermonema lapsum TaxID=28195 RepID=A0A846MQP8_9BACT|nr:histidine--tRNA ligase [Thermonema lapsum]NIK73702.1 histidyl-tRNA synthetase [Thermonema lapsum]